MLLPSVARAAPAAPAARAGVMPLSTEGALPPQGEEQIGAAIEQALSSNGSTVVASDELGQALGSPLEGCTDEACLRDLAGKAEVTHLVRPSVRLVESDYVLAIEVLDATGTVLDRKEGTCEICGLSEAATMAGELVTSLASSLKAPTAIITVSSTPVGATVLVDGEPVGVTPLSLDVSPGEHTVTVRNDGYADQERRVVVEAGDTEPIESTLDPAGPAPRKRGMDDARRDRMLRIMGWTGLGVGAASVASGIALIAIDERPVEFTRCSGDDVDAAGNCRFRHQTLGGGVFMSVLGVVGLTAGTILVVRDRKRNHTEERVRLRPSAQGLVLHF